MWDHFFWRKERDSLRYPSPKNSPPDCFCGRNFVSAAGSFESPSFQFDKKSDPTMWDHFFWRKERDSNPRCFIGHTRFPVVRLRPAQPSFHNGSCCVHSTRKCLIIYQAARKKSSFFCRLGPPLLKEAPSPARQLARGERRQELLFAVTLFGCGVYRQADQRDNDAADGQQGVAQPDRASWLMMTYTPLMMARIGTTG